MKNRLEELRKERGIKQEQLASVLEVSRQTISSLEKVFVYYHLKECSCHLQDMQ